jgi:ethanolamine ammonia-lyase small subunit
MGDDDKLDPASAWPEIVRQIRERTPARIFMRRGTSYSTQMELDLRSARASAVDAVWTEFDLQKDFTPDFVRQWDLFQISSQAETKSQFLLRPDLGRKLSEAGRDAVIQRCAKSADLQIVIGDGLSGAAISEQVPALFPLLLERARANRWSTGSSFVVRYCRVGVINEIGEILSPRVVVLLIGERPGLATSASLSAYMAYAPNSIQTDADRNVISNIHPRGLGIEDAAERIMTLAAQMVAQKRSGTMLKGDPMRLSGDMGTK